MVRAVGLSASPRIEASSSALAFEPWAPDWHLSSILSSAAFTSCAPRLRERERERETKMVRKEERMKQSYTVSTRLRPAGDTNTHFLIPVSVQQRERFPGRRLQRERETTELVDRNSALHHIICSWHSEGPEARRKRDIRRHAQYIVYSVDYSEWPNWRAFNPVVWVGFWRKLIQSEKFNLYRTNVCNYICPIQIKPYTYIPIYLSCYLLGHEFLNIVCVQVGVILLLQGRLVNWQELQHNKVSHSSR